MGKIKSTNKLICLCTNFNNLFSINLEERYKIKCDLEKG